MPRPQSTSSLNGTSPGDSTSVALPVLPLPRLLNLNTRASYELRSRFGELIERWPRRSGSRALFQIVGDDLHDALRIGRRFSRALRIEHGHD